MSNQITIYYGKGEYALTSANIDRLTNAVSHYIETAEWKWALQDCLGINADGKFGKRFSAIQSALKNSEDSKVGVLLAAMSSVVAHDASEIKRIRKATSAEIEAKRTEAYLKLIDAGFDEVTAERMTKVVR